MPVSSFTIYEVPNSYVSAGTSPTISGVFTLSVTDDDGFLNATAASDTGTLQTLTFSGGPVDSYNFFYNDTISFGGATETIKTFQMTVGGTTRSFVMNDTGTTIPGAGTGVNFSLNSYTGYTPLAYSSPACFTRGTRIETISGDRAIEDICLGDLVATLDSGFQPVRWVGSSAFTVRDILSKPHLRPVKIAAGVMGGDLPKRELRVSPQHRVLVTGWQVEVHFGENEALTPAISLTKSKGIEVDETCREVEYFHMMFDRHEVVFSEGLATESFLVGDTIRDELDRTQLDEIFDIFPNLATRTGAQGPTPARTILKAREMAALNPVG